MAPDNGSIQPDSEVITISVSRRFEAPAEQVFNAWLDPENIGRWLFKTADGEMVRVEVDPRVGGCFTIVEKRGEMLAEHFGTYVLIDPPRKLAFSFSTDRTSKPSLVTIEITPMSDGCELVLIHEIDRKWADYVDRVRSGWTMILDGLAGILS